jgi:hypothetical protein
MSLTTEALSSAKHQGLSEALSETRLRNYVTEMQARKKVEEDNHVNVSSTVEIEGVSLDVYLFYSNEARLKNTFILLKRRHCLNAKVF